jgi:ubiquinone biosynthesis protein
MREAASASQLKRNFQGSDSLYVPTIYWPYCRKNILVMEKISGIPIADMDSLREHNVNLKVLAERGVEIFYTQVFRDCFFHADMHPGNIFVSKENPDNPKYIAIDFGIMGTLTSDDKHYLAGNFLAFFRRDYKSVAELHIESGWVPADTRVDELESAIRTVCEPIFEKPLKDISYGQTLLRLFQIAQRFNMQVQPQLLLLQKTLLSIEGLGRTLYPELDLWKTAKPFLEDWMHKQVGFKGFINRAKDQLPFLSERLPELPDLIYGFLKNYKSQGVTERTIKEKPAKPTGAGFSYGLASGLGLAFVLYFGLSFFLH